MRAPRRTDMLQCGRCGRAVSVSAVACKRCGAGFDEIPPRPMEPRGFDPRLGWFILGGLLGLAAVVIVLLALRSGARPPS